MGFIKHHAIVVTSSDDRKIFEAFGKAKEVGLEVLPPGPPTVNGYRTLLICPDGSKEGWTESDEGDTRRELYIDWLRGNISDWVEVVYGHDLDKPYIDRHPTDEDEVNR